MKGYYDSDANLVGTTMSETLADLPAKGQQEIKAKYKEYPEMSFLLFKVMPAARRCANLFVNLLTLTIVFLSLFLHHNVETDCQSVTVIFVLPPEQQLFHNPHRQMTLQLLKIQTT